MSAQDLPPAVREQLTRFDQFQQNLQAIMVQKQQVDLELIEIEKATSELIKAKPTDPVYKTSGSILVKVNKTDLSKELAEKKEVATTRQMVLSKQEVRLKDNVKELQSKLEQSLKSVNPKQ